MTKQFFIPFLLFSVILSISSCKDKTEAMYMANTPIYQDFDAFRATQFSLTSPRQITHAGKLWVKDNFLFVVDVLDGIHIFDNSNPSDPINLGYLKIFACTDIAVNGNALYADNYNDLLTFDITNILDPQLQCRTENIFNFKAANAIGDYNQSLPAVGVIWEKGVIIGWNQEEVTEEIGGGYYFDDNIIAFDNAAFSESSGVNSSLNTTSVGGSMARFTVTGNHLQVLEERVLTTFNLTGACPEEAATININRTGETLFSAQGNLFIGTTTGMLIYNLSDPGNPTFISEYPHVASCDPVVISGNKAYVTLRTGNRCQGDINELAIIDISDLYNPAEIATYSMTNPHGLGINGSTLFLCDGSDGLKVFDVENPYDLGNNFISHFQNILAYDVIPLENQLIMSAQEGIYQYDYSDLNSITQLSLISTP